MSERKPVEYWLTDKHRVLVHEEQAIPCAFDFIQLARPVPVASRPDG